MMVCMYGVYVWYVCLVVCVCNCVCYFAHSRAKMIRVNRHAREQTSELTNQDILDIVKAFYSEGGTYRTALAYIRETEAKKCL